MGELKEIRKDRELRPEAVGYLAGVDAATISRIENEQVRLKPKTVVVIIAPNEETVR